MYDTRTLLQVLDVVHLDFIIMHSLLDKNKILQNYSFHDRKKTKPVISAENFLIHFAYIIISGNYESIND